MWKLIILMFPKFLFFIAYIITSKSNTIRNRNNICNKTLYKHDIK